MEMSFKLYYHENFQYVVKWGGVEFNINGCIHWLQYPLYQNNSFDREKKFICIVSELHEQFLEYTIYTKQPKKITLSITV